MKKFPLLMTNKEENKMKKIISLVLTLVLAVSALMPANVFASGISVTINGNYVNFDQPPVE